MKKPTKNVPIMNPQLTDDVIDELLRQNILPTLYRADVEKCPDLKNWWDAIYNRLMAEQKDVFAGFGVKDPAFVLPNLAVVDYRYDSDSGGHRVEFAYHDYRYPVPSSEGGWRLVILDLAVDEDHMVSTTPMRLIRYDDKVDSQFVNLDNAITNRFDHQDIFLSPTAKVPSPPEGKTYTNEEFAELYKKELLAIIKDHSKPLHLKGSDEE